MCVKLRKASDKTADLPVDVQPEDSPEYKVVTDFSGSVRSSADVCY